MERPLPLEVSTERPLDRLRATEWLRVALLAGLAGALVAIVFDLTIAERILDRAVRVERGNIRAALAMPEPFSRSGQHGGLAAGELILGAGVGFLLAGALTFVGARAQPVRRLWLLATAAAIWSVVVLPAIVYPPLPPGVASELPIRERQQLYLAVVGIGLAAFGAGVRVWSSGRRFSKAASVATAVVPAALAVALFPDNAHETIVSPRLLIDFRIVSIVAQLLFWTTIGVVGALLLRNLSRRRAGAAGSLS